MYSVIIFLAIMLILQLIRIYIRSYNPNFTYSRLLGLTFDGRKELVKMNPKGFTFGQKGINFICRDEEQEGHILVVGGSGSGKSSCIIIPTLLTWQARVFAIDIKGELSKTTAHKRGGVKCFEVGNPSAYGYNPFYLLTKTTNVAEVVNDIATSLIPVPSNVKDPFWIQSAQNIFKAVLYYLIPLNYTFIEAIELITTTNIVSLIDEIKDSSSNEARASIMPFVGLDSKVLTGIYVELSHKLITFIEDRELCQTLRKSNVITPDDIEKGYDIYIVIDESQLEQYSNLLTLIINQFLKSFERRPERFVNEPVLFVLDEFPRLGKINSIIGGLGTLRSKGITICIAVQSLAQIEAIYGEVTRKVIADNCVYKAVLKASDPETQNYFSRLVGTKNVEKKTFSRGKGEGLFQKTTETISHIEEPIVKPPELAYISQILLITPKGYMWVDKTPYFSNPVLKRL